MIETNGTVISSSRQWWLKINTKPVRLGTMDGAVFPYVIKIRYSADGREYTVRKWIAAGEPVPVVGSTVRLCFDASKPSKAKML